MRRGLVILALLLTFVGAAALGSDESDPVGDTEVNGYRIAPAADMPPQAREGDSGPTQIFEIIRPNNGAIQLSRLVTTCECVQLEADSAYFGEGQRAFLRLRNVKPTSGKTYTFYVQIASPEGMVLKYDAYVISDNPPPAEEDEDEENDSEKKSA